MELIIIKRNGQLEYYDKFQLDIDTRHIVIKQSKNENDYLYITVKRSYVHQNAFQRILCIDECESDRKKYLLIFANVEECNKFTESVKTSKAKNTLHITISNDVEKFHSRYFTPIINACLENTFMDKELEPLISEFLKYYTNDEQEDDISLLDDEAATTVTSNESVNPIFATQNATNEKPERTYQINHAASTVDERLNSINANISTENNSISNVITQNDEENNRPRRSLRIPDNNIFYFVDDAPVKRKLKRKYQAKVHQQSEPNPKKTKLFSLDKRIYAPNFKYFHYLRMGNTRSTLIIFPNSDRTKCYEYYYDFKRKKYICRGCGGINKQSTPARIERDTNGVDYVICERTDHICELRQYKPEKYKSDYIIEKPNYDIVKQNVINTDGVEEMRDFLLLYTSTDKKNYFKFSWDNHQKLFYCGKCSAKKSNGAAKSYIQAFVHEGVVYVRNVQHLCSAKKYLKVIETSVMPETENYQPPVRQWNKRYKPQKKTSMKKRQRKAVKTKLAEAARSKRAQILSMSKALKNRDTIQQRQSENPPTPQILDESKIIRKPYYRIFEREYQGRMLKKLATFDSNDATMCYELSWVKRDKVFSCNYCSNRFKIHVTAKIIKNDDEEEYVQMGKHDHKCELQKFTF